MKLELNSWEEFLQELSERKLGNVYFHFDEFDRYIRFTAADNNMLLSYVEKDFLMPNDKYARVQSLTKELKDIEFKRGIISE